MTMQDKVNEILGTCERMWKLLSMVSQHQHEDVKNIYRQVLKARIRDMNSTADELIDELIRRAQTPDGVTALSVELDAAVELSDLLVGD